MGEDALRSGLELDRDLLRAELATEMFGAARDVVRLGRFEIIRRLGRGAMGMVYEARDSESGSRVALKCLNQLDARAVYRLKREFRSLSGASHPNLVALHGLFCEDGLWFLTMEIVDGVALSRWVRNSAAGAFDERRLRAAFAQLAFGVDAIHAAGKVHCDLKPSNVLVTAAGRVVLLDFGLVSEQAHASDPQSVLSGVQGTPAYMAPEQAGGSSPSIASDWYAVGVMLFEALTGQLPFDGNALRVLQDKQRRSAPDPRQFDRELPVDLSELCVELLRRDPTARCGVQRVLQVVAGEANRLSATTAAGGSVAQPSVFVGRELELAMLHDAFARMRAGRMQAVVISGLSGIGKSALLQRFVADLGAEAVVLRGRCHPQESVPYKAFDQVIDALGRHLRGLPQQRVEAMLPRYMSALVQLFPALAQVDAIARAAAEAPAAGAARELRNQAFSALRELLRRIGERSPLVLLVDDLQWSDIDSARLLTHVFSPPEPPSLLLVGACRSDEIHGTPFLQALLAQDSFAADDCVRQVELEPLADEWAAELARSRLSGTAIQHRDGIVRSVLIEAGGAPFLICELIDHLNARIASSTRTDTGHTRVSLEEVILARVAELPESAQRLLRALSIAADPLDQRVAVDAAGLGADERGAVARLLASRLIRSRSGQSGDELEVYHDRIRETVTSAVDAGALRRVHEAIANALERHRVVDPERFINHYIGAGDLVRARGAAIQAARAAAGKLAFNRGAELYRKALELLPAGDASRRELHEHLGDALANAGRGAQAAEAYLQAAEDAAPPELRRLLRLAAQQYLRSGNIDEGSALARRLFAAVGLRFPETKTQVLLSYVWSTALLQLSAYSYDPDDKSTPDENASERVATLDAVFREIVFVDLLRGAALQVQFLRYAQRAKDPERVMHGLAWQAWRAAMTNANPMAALRILSKVDHMAGQLGTPYARATAKSARAGCALFLRRPDEVHAPALEAEQLFRDHCAGSHWEQNVVATYRYVATEYVGGFRTIMNEVPARCRDALDRGDRLNAGLLSLSIAFNHLVLDRPQDAIDFIDRESEHLPPVYGPFHFHVGVRKVHALLYMGEAFRALDFFNEEKQRFDASPCARGIYYRTIMSSLNARCCLAAVGRGHHASRGLLRSARQDASAILETRQPGAEALGLLLLAEAAWKDGDEDRAQALLTSCMNGTETHHSPMLGVYAQRCLGVAVGGSRGAELVAEADRRLRDENVTSPDRWTRIWIDMERRSLGR